MRLWGNVEAGKVEGESSCDGEMVRLVPGPPNPSMSDPAPGSRKFKRYFWSFGNVSKVRGQAYLLIY